VASFTIIPIEQKNFDDGDLRKFTFRQTDPHQQRVLMKKTFVDYSVINHHL
jgi:hypothetical protein